MSLAVLGPLGTYVVMECVTSTHMNNYNMSIGVLGPLRTYIIIKWVEGGHRLPYDPLRLI